MGKAETSQEWQLIVNGEHKPWPVVDYMSTPITINLNWGIDTSKYETTPITFSLKELLDGKNIPEVDIDKGRKIVTCSIPIKEKEKQYKVLADFSPIKESLNDSLTVVVKGRPSPIKNRILILKGEEVGIHPMILYKGKKCKYELNDEEGIVKIVIPIDSSDNSNPKLKFKQKLFDSKYFLLIGILIGFLIGMLSTYNSRKAEVESKEQMVEDALSHETDNMGPSYSLREAIAYLDNHEVWEKCEMEKYDDLKGLFDDMNNFKYKSVINNYSQLERSTNYRKLQRFCEREDYKNPKGNDSESGSRSTAGSDGMSSTNKKQPTTHSQISYTHDGKITIYKYIEKGRMHKNKNSPLSGTSSSINEI